MLLLILLLKVSVLVTVSAREEETLWPRSEDCCPSVLVSSPSLASSAQPLKLGLYRNVGVMNRRRVYQHEASQAWLYYYDWGSGHGANWMFGDAVGSEYRGIESTNLQARALDAQWCPEDVNVSKVSLFLSSTLSTKHQSSVPLEGFDCPGPVERGHEAEGRVLRPQHCQGLL